MNRKERQDYRDATADEAKAKGYDLAQLKYNGWWDRIEILGGKIQHYSQTGRLFKEDTIVDTSLECTLIGEHMIGRQWALAPERAGRTYLFDCWAWGGTNLLHVPYRDRYRVARLAPQRLSAMFQVVQTYRIMDAMSLWETQVASGAFEGLIYRRGSDDVTGTVLREKLTFTEDVLCVGFAEGMGKYAGTLGALICETKEGKAVNVGGGFSDEEREQIYNNQPAYLNKWLEVKAWDRTDSGSLQSPNFIRWRFDK